MRTFRVSRIRSDIRFATRRERDYRIPPDFNIEDFRGRAVWQLGDIRGEAALEVKGDTAWWVERTFGDSGRLEDGVFRTEYSSLGQLASWILRQDGRAVPLECSLRLFKLLRCGLVCCAQSRIDSSVQRGQTRRLRQMAPAAHLPAQLPRWPRALLIPVDSRTRRHSG